MRQLTFKQIKAMNSKNRKYGAAYKIATRMISWANKKPIKKWVRPKRLFAKKSEKEVHTKVRTNMRSLISTK